MHSCGPPGRNPPTELRKIRVRRRQGAEKLQIGAAVELAQPVEAELDDPLRRELAAGRLDCERDLRHERSTSAALTCRLWVERRSAARSFDASKR